MLAGDTFSPKAIDSSEVMYVKRYLAPTGWALGMLVLILDGKTALSGAAEGVQLCICTLIPSLFPFFVLSAMLSNSLPRGGLLLTGILGGYPAGAANVARAYRMGRLSREEAAQMVVLCNCAGPSFLFGVAAPMLGGAVAGFALWGVYLLSVLALHWTLPGSRKTAPSAGALTLHQAVWDSIRAMAGVCGWVVLFRVVLAVADRWALWLLPDWGKTVVYGLLELSNGCLALGSVPGDMRFVLAAGMVSFGGLCVMLQTAGVAQGIPMGLYFPGKAFQACVAMLLASLIRPGGLKPGIQMILLLTALMLGLLLRKSENRCGNPRPVGV